MRVLVTSTPGTGHIHPLVPLAAELQTAGHEVVWATAADSCGRVERYGFRAVPAGMTGDERTRLFFAKDRGLLSLPERERRTVVLPVLFGELAAPRMRDDLVQIVEDLRPDVILHDLVELATPPVATARGIPHVTVAFGATLSPALLEASAVSVAPVWAAEGLVPSSTAGIYDHVYLHPLPSSLDEPPASRTVRAVRPMHFDGAAGSAAPTWTDEFGRDRPGIYATFGTEMAGLAPWTAVIEALGGIDADVVATVGPEVDPLTLGTLPSNVRVERYVPQRYLLDRARVVVSHAGSGTMFATAERGLPQLCLPVKADQWDNADALASTGAGLTLELGDRDAPSIHDAIVRLLDGTTHRDAARTLAQDFAALPHPREHVAEIESLS